MREVAELVIRRYRPADHGAVCTLHTLALGQVGANAGDGPWDEDLRHVEDVYLENRGEFLVGEIDGQIVAMGAIKRVSGDQAEVKRMRVHPDHQRRGYGRAILERLESRARELGYSVLCLHTTVRQVPAQRLDTSHGYREVGRTIRSGFECILYEKTIGETPNGAATLERQVDKSRLVKG